MGVIYVRTAAENPNGKKRGWGAEGEKKKSRILNDVDGIVRFHFCCVQTGMHGYGA